MASKLMIHKFCRMVYF